MKWTIDDAQEHLDELLDRTQRDGPQTVVRGDRRYIFMTQRREHYERRKRALEHRLEDTHGLESSRREEPLQ